jgi:hypothetical protein
MDEFVSFAGVIALWLGASFGLWGLHRRSVYAKQRRQMRQAVRAAAHVAEAQGVFDAIRGLSRNSAVSEGAELTAAAHALLKRMQSQSAFFDQVNVLRIDMLAAFGMDDFPPLSDLLHIRRDLWAASEIALVEDLSSFSESFAEEGASERFRAEAAALLFKAQAPTPAEEDVIDLRLSLARAEAERFVPELKEAIRLARERDRLPSFAEIIAYPIAAIRTVPGKLAVARAFLGEFYRYAMEMAGAIRRSEVMERGVSELRRAREELPHRLVTGFERASETARQSATGLRRHYDFLVAAHDFQAKYELTLRRAPEITERGRQFIARLELAERSERLRLTSANLLIWLARQLATGLAHGIAGLQQLHAILRETPPGALAAALVAPTPVRGRHVPAYQSYRRALAASGLRELPPQVPVAATGAMMPKRENAGKPTARSANGRAKKPSAKPGVVKAAAPSVQPARAAAKVGATVASAAKPGAIASAAVAAPPPAKSKRVPRPAPDPAPRATTGPPPVAKHPAAPEPVVGKNADRRVALKQPKPAPGPDRAKLESAPNPEPPSPLAKRAAAPASPKSADPSAQPPAAPDQAVPPEPRTAAPALAMPRKPAIPAPRRAAPPEPATMSPNSAAPSGHVPAPIAVPPAQAEASSVETPIPSRAPEKRRSFFDRLFGRKPPEWTIAELLAAALERENAAEASANADASSPAETAPTLLAKLSQLPEEDIPEELDEAQDEQLAEDESAEDSESLTSSVMEVQARLAPRPPIRSFPWLRG